jgi:hypothetical protein
MQKEFNKQLNIHLNQWVQNSQSIRWSNSDQPFFSVRSDSDIMVNLDLLSEPYGTRHIMSGPGDYCHMFLSVLEPYLAQFLIQFGIREYEFTFCFLIDGTTFKDCMLTAA